ncbi:MAG: S-layer homology domain-containing protein [Thermoleophilia bacterium]|nr:S-layer homology domain-containing protein [Thermoleophilia bacterium]
MTIKGRLTKRTIVVLIAVMLALAGTAAYAASSFTDVPADYWAHDSIIKLADQGIILGHADGSFGPEESITRAQAAVMLDRQQQYMASQEMAPLAQINRGCPSCHPTAVGDPAAPPFTPGRPDPDRGNAPTFSLKWEAMGGDPTSARFAVHNGLPDTATVNTCLGCHAAGDGEQNGTVAPISLRVIVHPVHLNSGIFLAEFRGNCFTCHDVTNDGDFDILTQAVTVDDKGIPEEIPTPGLQGPSGPAAE